VAADHKELHTRVVNCAEHGNIQSVLKKGLFAHQGQVDFLAWQATFHSDLPDGHGIQASHLPTKL